MKNDDTAWPAWFYGPNGEAEVFEAAADVPSGWKDHPSLHAEKAPAAPAAPEPPTAPKPPVESGEGTDEADADGWPWQANLHAASKSKTSQGLWRMKVGVSRPEPKKLDL